MLVLFVVAVIAAISLAAFRRSRAETPAPASPSLPAVTVALVEAREIVEHAEFTGRVRAIDDVEVRARVSGHLQKVHFQNGALVRANDVLFTIDARWNEATLHAAEAQLAQARVQLENAEREARRATQLLQTQAISSEESESRTARLAESKAAVLAAEANATSARLDLEFTQVRAPIDGRVDRAFVTPGNFISGPSTLLTTIVSVDPVYVDADVDETSLLTLRNLIAAQSLPLDDGGRVRVDVGLTDEEGFPTSGALESLGNRFDPNTGSIVLRAVVPNPDSHLVPGMYARLRVPMSAARKTVLISDRAIGTDQSQKFVLVLGADDTVEYRSVQLGPVIDGLRVIRSGLAAGEKIVVNGLQRVRPGSKVAPRTEAAPSEKR